MGHKGDTGDTADLKLQDALRPTYSLTDSAEDLALRRSDILKYVDEPLDAEKKTWKHVLRYGWTGAGGSLSDAWLTTACAQIGQVMLAVPHAMALTGLRAGIPIIILYSLVAMWTIHLMKVLFMEHKARKVEAGTWRPERAPQYFEVATGLLGRPIGAFVLLITLVSYISTSVAQIIASSTGLYYLDERVSKRNWALIWGALLTGTFSCVPTFRHFRLLSIIGIIGTAYTACFVIGSAAAHGNTPGAFRRGPTSFQGLALGMNVVMSAFGGHTTSFEIMGAMFQPSRYDRVYPLSYLFIYFVTVPHSILTQLAWPADNLKYGNVYGTVPKNAARDVSIALMIVHQCVAYAIYIMPAFFMWEKLIRTHDKPLWIRLPSRLPVALFVWLLAMLFPFYDTVNAIMGALGNSFGAFVFPTGFYLWVYRTAAARRTAPEAPPRWIGGWTGAMLLNTIIFLYFLGIGVFAGAWAAIQNLIDNISHLGLFAECYQCDQIRKINIIQG